MVVGKIISIFDISVEVILNEDKAVKIGDILTAQVDKNYSFEVVTINNISATCISLGSTRGLKKGSEVIKLSNGIEIEYSDKILGRVFDSYGVPMDGKPLETVTTRNIAHNTVSLKEVDVTLEDGIEAALLNEVPEVIKVVNEN